MRNFTKYQRLIVLILRISLGFLFLYAGGSKLLEGFSAGGYLLNATVGPFTESFAALAGNPVVDFLVVWGEILIGLALIFGVFTRFTAIMGSLMMFLFYLSILPPENGPINEKVIYTLVFILLGIFGAGRYYGIDKYLEQTKIVKENWNIFKFLLG
jgi:thiosulfate dehydrogenase [quinone] large subunit